MVVSSVKDGPGIPPLLPPIEELSGPEKMHTGRGNIGVLYCRNKPTPDVRLGEYQ